ncbi:MAG: glycosyltransferase, partial [Arcobacteraceae bacterium]
MKILYISRATHDYLQDFIYTGLVKRIGISNILEFPWNIRFHINHRPYPKNIGLIKGNLFQSLYHSYIKKFEYTHIIVASCHPEALLNYQTILKEIPAHVKTIFLDGGDLAEVAGDLNRIKEDGIKIYNNIEMIRPFDFIFKREYLLDKIYPSNVYSLPFCFNLHLLPKKLPQTYKYDVAFWAVESHPIRTQALELLQDKYDCKENGTTKNQIMKKYKRKGTYYLQELSACKIGLNLRGAGWDTLRFWELSALGSFMISQKLNIKIENGFTNNKNIIYCEDDISDLVELCDYYLKHENKRIKIAQNAKKHIYEHHTDLH